MKVVGMLAAAVVSSLAQVMCAQADEAVDRLKTCSQLEGLDRLKCVDDVLAKMVDAPDATPSQGPNWIVSETTSPVDYQPQIAASTTAHGSSPDAPSSLTIRCRAHRTELIIATRGNWKLPPVGEAKVVYRINDEPPVEQSWKVADIGNGLAFPGDVARLLRAMPDGGRMLVKVFAGKSPSSESTFQLAGLDPVRHKVATACNWAQPP